MFSQDPYLCVSVWLYVCVCEHACVVYTHVVQKRCICVAGIHVPIHVLAWRITGVVLQCNVRIGKISRKDLSCKPRILVVIDDLRPIGRRMHACFTYTTTRWKVQTGLTCWISSLLTYLEPLFALFWFFCGWYIYT